MATTLAKEELVRQKLATFEQLQPEFEASFGFIRDVHGQRRFIAFPIAETVHYLHALWVCACKDRLLSVSNKTGRYEGDICLKLLRNWQEGESATVVAFLQRKLDGMPFADLTQQIQTASTMFHIDSGSLLRLVHGRFILLNRGMNLMRALDAIFALPQDELMQEVHVACERFGHNQSQIEQQLAERESPLFEYIPHQLLAQRNMLAMNKVGVHTMMLPADLPEERLWQIVASKDPKGPLAEQIISGYREQT